MNKAKFIEENVSENQIRWGNNADPRDILKLGQFYEIDRIDVHSQSTGIFLKEFPGKKFNSVWFDCE